MPRQGTTRGRYSFKDHGQSSRGGLTGVYVLKENAGCTIYRPSWNRTRTIFRIFPGRNPENPAELDPFRLSDEPRDYGDWIRRYDAIVALGNPGTTFIIRDPREDDTDVQQNPCWMLFRAIDGAVKRGQCDPSWNPLRFGASGRAAQLSAPTDIYLVQGVLMEHRSKPQNPPLGIYREHQTCVLMMSQSAGRALLDELDKRDADGNYIYPDVVDLDVGAFIDIHQAGTPTMGQAARGGPNAPMLGTGGNIVGPGGMPQGNPGENRYECTILSDYNGIPPTLTQARDIVLPKIKAWDDIVRHFSIPEQVSMICSSGLPASAVVYALQEAYGEHIPQSVYEQARAAHANPGYYGGQQQARPQQGPSPFGAPQPPQPAQNPMQPQQPSQPQQPTQSPQPPQAAPLLGQAAQPTGEMPQHAQPQLAPGVPQGGIQGGSVAQPQPTQAAEPPQAAAQVPPGFDPQPTHADPAAVNSTLEALEAARARMRQAGGGQSG